MPHEPSRLQPIDGPASESDTGGERVSLMTRLAQAERLTDVLPHIHRQALEATGGSKALLFEHNPRTGALHATSGYAVEALGDEPWYTEEGEHALVSETFRRRAPTLVIELARQMPDLALRLACPAALLVPIARGTERVALLAIGFDHPPDLRRVRQEIGDLPDTLLTTLELFRLRGNVDRQRDVRELGDELAASLATAETADSGLELLCRGANRLFAADRTSLWMHDRRARHLVLQASSDPMHLTHRVRVSADDAFAPAAVALRQAHAGIVDEGGRTPTVAVTVPLRGCRRALGTLLLEGVRIETGSELDVLDRADELGRQVSTAIESAELIDAVRRARRELESTFDSISHLVVVTDRRGRIVHANQEFAARLHTPREQLVDRSLRDCVGPELSGWLETLDSDAPRGTLPTVCEVEDSVLDGAFIVTVSELRDFHGRPAGHVLIARDVASHSDVEAEREELRKQLTQSEKLAALGQFVAGIAHELNNPLQSVLGHLELLRATGEFSRAVRQQIHTVSREADRAAKIVRNLLVFAGSGKLSRRAVSINALLRRVVSLRQHPCRVAHIQIVRHYEQGLPRIKSDPLALHQVFLNMITNAEQSITGAGRPGRIDITTSTIEAGNRIAITIRDTGNGIPPEALSRLFEPFYTTKDVGKGTGLGLAIAYGIVQDHGGDIVAANHPDGGAILTVELPVG